MKSVKLSPRKGEIWKSHPVLPLLISSLGRIKRPDGLGAHLNFNDKGYLRVSVSSVYYQVHRLVAITFIPNPENKRCVNHKRGVKTDNRVKMLEWATHSENFIHALKWGLNPNGKGANNPRSKKVRQINIKTGKVVKIFGSANEVERKTGFDQAGISRAATLKNRTAYGFKWEYV